MTQKYIGFFSQEIRIDAYTFHLGPLYAKDWVPMAAVALVDDLRKFELFLLQLQAVSDPSGYGWVRSAHSPLLAGY